MEKWNVIPVNYSKITEMGKDKFIPRIPRKDAPKWRKPVDILIKTRQELIDFAYTDRYFYDENDIRSFMPVNSFTDPDALFSEDEYMTSEVEKIIYKLAERQVYTFERYLKLLEHIRINDMNTALDVIDSFFSWGINGLRAVICRKNIIELRNPLLPINYKGKEVLFTKKDYTFMNSKGEIYKEMPPDWTYIYSRETIKNLIGKLNDSREWCVLPIHARVDQSAIEYYFEKLKIIISPAKYKVEFQGYATLYDTIKVVSPNYTFLNHDFWGLDCQEVRDKLFNNIQVESILKYIIDRITVNSNASSYWMYRALSLSPKAAVETILYKQKEMFLDEKSNEKAGAMAYLNEKGENGAIEIDALKYELPFLEEKFSISDDTIEDSSPIIRMRDKIIAGEINLDNILDGIQADGMEKNNELYNFIEAAMTKLGYLYEELFLEASKINPSCNKPYYFILEKNGIRISIKLHLCDFKLSGYNKDLIDTKNWISREAVHWCIVTDVYTEPSDKLARHVAVRMKTWPHYLYGNRKGEMTTYIEDLIKSQLQQFYNETEPICLDTANVIYNIYRKNYENNDDKIILELCIGTNKIQKRLSFSNTIVSMVLSNLEDRFDGTLEISDCATRC